MTLRLLLIAVAIILLLSWLSFEMYTRAEEFKVQARDNLALANDSGRVARRYRDQNGLLHSQNQVLTIATKNARELLASEELAWTAKFEGLKRNAKNLTQTVKIEGRVDTVFADRLEYVDRYNQIKCDSVGLKVKIEVPIQGVVYWKRPHNFLFLHWGRKKYESDFVSLNPLVKLRNSEVMVIRKK